jgi:hypothetical protein
LKEEEEEEEEEEDMSVQRVGRSSMDPAHLPTGLTLRSDGVLQEN